MRFALLRHLGAAASRKVRAAIEPIAELGIPFQDDLVMVGLLGIDPALSPWCVDSDLDPFEIFP